ncbi:hypothetical protein HK102_013208 [Quaeritorhiza haematococci]|nr:hypothetical protein HK102_013208 [Quaeritorhiza haematococci]
MAMNFGPEWMRKMPVHTPETGRASPNMMSHPAPGPAPANPTYPSPASAWHNGTANLFAASRQSNAQTTMGSTATNHAHSQVGHHGGLQPSNDSGAGAIKEGESNPFRYSRELILSLFDPHLPVPADFEAHEHVTSKDPNIPLANIPLSDQEKKLLSLPSVNSDVRRTPYQQRGEGKDNAGRPPRPGAGPPGSRRPERTPSSGERGYRRPGEMDEDPWDTPSGLGSFNSNGVFSFADQHSRGKGERGPAGENKTVEEGKAAESSPIRAPVDLDAGSTPSLSRVNGEGVDNSKPDASPTHDNPQATPTSAPTAPSPLDSAVGKNEASSVTSATSEPSSGSQATGGQQSRFAEIFDPFGTRQLNVAISERGAGLGSAGAVGSPSSATRQPDLNSGAASAGAGLVGGGGFGSLGLGGALGGQTLRVSLSKDNLQQAQPGHHSPAQSLGMSPNPPMPPPGIGAGLPSMAPFVPQKWLYKDPNGVVQGKLPDFSLFELGSQECFDSFANVMISQYTGPFSAIEMHEWYKTGYFTGGLPVKRVDDHVYEPLARLIQKYGTDRPFLADLEEAERLYAAQLEHQRRGGFGRTNSGFKELYQSDANAFDPFHFAASSTSAGASSLFGNSGLGDMFGSRIPGRQSNFPGMGVDVAGAAGAFGVGWGDNPATRPSWGLLGNESFVRGAGMAAGPMQMNPLQAQYLNDQRMLNQPQPLLGLMNQPQQFSSFMQQSQPLQGQNPMFTNQQQPNMFEPFVQGGLQGAQGLVPGAAQMANLAQPTSRSSTADWGMFPMSAGVVPSDAGAGLHGPNDAADMTHPPPSLAPTDIVASVVDDGHPPSPLMRGADSAQPEDLSPSKPTSEDEIVEGIAKPDVSKGNQEAFAADEQAKEDEEEHSAEHKQPAQPSVAKPQIKEAEKPTLLASGKSRKAAKREEKEKAEKEEEKRKQEKEKKDEEASSQDAKKKQQQHADQPAVDLRSIMNEENVKSKKEKEAKALQKSKELDREVEAIRAQQQQSRPPAPVWGTPVDAGSAQPPKLSLKEIQEIEQRERQERERERQRRAQQAILAQAAQIQEQEAAAAAAGQILAGGTVWGGATKKPAPARQKTLLEIMQEEEARKKKVAEIKGPAATPEVPLGVGKRYADTIVVASAGSVGGGSGYAAATVTSGSTGGGAAWGSSGSGASAGPRTVVGMSQRAPAPVVAAPKVVPAGAVRAPSWTETTQESSSQTSWNVVGKQGTVRPSAATVVGRVPGSIPAKPGATSTSVRSAGPGVGSSPMSRPVSVSAAVRRNVPGAVSVSSSGVNGVAASAADGNKGPTEAFLQWCRTALKPLERSGSAEVRVEQFIEMLLAIPDADTIKLICDDTLGGLTAMDARKFAEEFMRRRKSDSSSSSSGVGGSPSAAWGGVETGFEGLETQNKFVMVGKAAKKKKKKGGAQN